MKLRSGKTYRYKNMARKRSRRPAKKVSAAVKTYVKRTIASNQENKMWISYGINNTISSCVTPNYPTAINLVPILNTGVNANQRTGNQVKIKRAFITGKVNLLPYDAATNTKVCPAYVKMWLCKSKVINTNAITNTSINGDFFQGNGAELGFQGTVLDTLLTPNNDTWQVVATKTFHLGLTTQSQNALLANAGYFDNERFAASFYFNYTKHLKKKLTYIDSGTICQNANLFLVMQCVYQDGSTSAVTSAEYHQSTRVEFEDA